MLRRSQPHPPPAVPTSHPSPDPIGPYGPNTPAIRAFLQRLATQPAVVWLAAARRHAMAAGSDDARTADRALAAAITRTGRVEPRDALVGPVLQMARRAAGLGGLDADDAEAVEGLAEPALAAALALVVADVLDARHQAQLTASYASLLTAPTP